MTRDEAHKAAREALAAFGVDGPVPLANARQRAGLSQCEAIAEGVSGVVVYKAKERLALPRTTATRIEKKMKAKPKRRRPVGRMLTPDRWV